MPESTMLHVTDDVVVLDHQPGNGTRYVVVITEASPRGRWCVAFPDFGSAYWVEEDQMDEPMHPNYIAEKWRIGGRAAGPGDAPHMAEAIFLAFKAVKG